MSTTLLQSAGSSGSGPSDMSLTQRVINANIAVHSRLASTYRTSEPHFRPENVSRVTRKVAALAEQTRARRLLDLGCGTGFMIDIAKEYVGHIVGVDVTPAMLEQVDRSGPATVELVTHDTGTYKPESGSFQLVTAYSFLHHLADLRSTFRTAATALEAGGCFYADLEPNFYFWESIGRLERGGDYHALVKREIEAVTYKDEEIQTRFGVSREIFSQAEYGKDITGGFTEEHLRELLVEQGFQQVDVHYHWFLGEGFLINSESAPRELLLQQAEAVDAALQRALPVSRSLFKYLGFVAVR